MRKAVIIVMALLALALLAGVALAASQALSLPWGVEVVVVCDNSPFRPLVAERGAGSLGVYCPAVASTLYLPYLGGGDGPE